MMNPAPHVMVASNQSVCALALWSTEARTANTMVSELVSRNAVMMVAFTMLSEWNGVGQFAVAMRPYLEACSSAPNVSESESRNSHIPIFFEYVPNSDGSYADGMPCNAESAMRSTSGSTRS